MLAGLPDGPCGLVFLIPTRGAVVQTIWFGTATSGSARPWPDVSNYPMK